jgi:hypothetical protein
MNGQFCNRLKQYERPEQGYGERVPLQHGALLRAEKGALIFCVRLLGTQTRARG